MKIVVLACALAAATAWAVVTLTTSEATTPGLDPFALDLEDRLASLEGRLARITARDDSPGLRPREQPAMTTDALERRVQALEDELARLRGASRPPGGSEGPERARGEEEGAEPEPRPDRTRPKQPTEQEAIEALRERLQRAPAASRARSLDGLAQRAGKAGLFELQEALLREVVEAAGRESPLAHEALYNIGWARRNRGDAAGAREAWRTALDALPRDHWRRGYARLMAAEQGIKSGEAGAARRELDDLIADIEARPQVVDPHGTLLQRSRTLLAGLAR